MSVSKHYEREKAVYKHPAMAVVKLSGNVSILQQSTGGDGPSYLRRHRGYTDWDEE